jgi:aryl-alcohol dehydrogenase-like predicted oxidoreductase
VVADRALEALRRVTGWSLTINPVAGNERNMALRLDRGLFPGLPAWQGDEGCRLSASASRGEVSACLLAQLVIAWTAAQPGVTHVLCGAPRVDQARENVAAGSLRLAAVDIEQMRRAVEALGEPQHRQAELTT